MDYENFIENKHFKVEPSGFTYKCDNPKLMDFQKKVVEWALSRGKAAVFLDTGLGKTRVQLEFAKAVIEKTGRPFLLLAPLSVGYQIHKEGSELGYDTNPVRSMDDVGVRINITNYENLHNIDFNAFSGIALDESSILKGMNGRIRSQLTDGARSIPYRISATATPSPNDFMEIGTQSEFLGIMTQIEMLATFFIHDGGDTSKWRLKGHGKQKFFEWLATWSVIMRDPSVYGFDPMPDLPAINIEQVEIETTPEDALFAEVANTLSDRSKARRETLEERCAKAAKIINALDGPVLIWCGLNDEGDLLEKLVDGAVQVTGSDKDHIKEDRLIGFTDGKYERLITKPKIAGFGMNWQHCNQMVFVGLSDSFEQYYQAVRRCWRFGQKKDVNVWVITADKEGAVVENIRRKQIQADTMMIEMGRIASMFFTGFDQATNELRAYDPKTTAPKPTF